MDLSVNNIFVVNAEEMTSLDRPRHRCENTAETDIRNDANGKASPLSEQSPNVTNARGIRDNKVYCDIINQRDAQFV